MKKPLDIMIDILLAGMESLALYYDERGMRDSYYLVKSMIENLEDLRSR